jgi:hypothetical protein
VNGARDDFLSYTGFAEDEHLGATACRHLDASAQRHGRLAVAEQYRGSHN